LVRYHQVILTVLLTAVGWGTSHGQSFPEFPSPELKESHKEYIHIVREADSLLYNRIVNLYEKWLTDHPGSISTRIEYCKFLEKVYYNDYEEYNPKYEEHKACLDRLLAKFPDEPAVIIYNSRFVDGDSAIVYLESLTGRIGNEPEIWDTDGLWQVYEKLAYEHSHQGNISRAMVYARDAMNMNEELDLSLLLARQYLEHSDVSTAVSILTQHIDSTNTFYDLYEKGELLYELEAYSEALKAYKLSSQQWDMDAELGMTLMQLGRFDEARPYLLKESNKYWNNRRSLEKLFLFDLEHSPADSAMATYNRLRELGLSSDPLLIYRLKVAFAGNGMMSGWQWRDLAALLILAAAFGIIFVIPYLWILPIYSYGLYKSKRLNRFYHPTSPTTDSSRWGLREFWLISTAYLFLVLAITLIYNYSALVGYLNHDLYEEITLSQAGLANSTIFFMILMALATTCFLRKDDIRLFWGKSNSKVKQFMTGFACIVALRIVYGILHQFFSLWLSYEWDGAASLVMSMQEEIIAIDAQYGFFWVFVLVVLLVPVYEEIIFRGIILDSVSNYLTFHWANLIQSVMFALLHENSGYFMFFVLFGLLAGYLRKRTGGFAASITFHAINNLIAIMTLL